MVKTSISNGGDGDLMPGWEAKIPHAAWPINIKQKNIVTNSIRTLKNDPHQKKNLKKRLEESDTSQIRHYIMI